MNILLIGNGFDLAHGLPTRYGDFLDYVQSTSNFMSDKMMKNMWLDGFLKRRVNLGQNWIDLESEIADVIKELEEWYSKDYRSDAVSSVPIIRKNYNLMFRAIQVTNPRKVRKPKQEVAQFLIKELVELILYLEMYLTEVASTAPTIVSKDLNVLHIDKLLTFNYTKTFKKLYDIDNKIEYDYIHGEIGSSTKNMVLGIDEYLYESEKDVNLDFVRFKKYFQRIQKRTGCTYKRWIEHIEETWYECNREPVYDGGKLLGYQCPPDANLYIYGHSLDVTDKDILQELILQQGVTTTIFYHNEESYAEKITNLIKVIGQDNLTKFVHGTNPKIKFQLQEDMIPAPVPATK